MNRQIPGKLERNDNGDVPGAIGPTGNETLTLAVQPHVDPADGNTSATLSSSVRPQQQHDRDACFDSEDLRIQIHNMQATYQPVSATASSPSHDDDDYLPPGPSPIGYQAKEVTSFIGLLDQARTD